MAARSRNTYNPDNTTRAKDQQEKEYGDEYTKKEKKKTPVFKSVWKFIKPGKEKKKESRADLISQTSVNVQQKEHSQSYPNLLTATVEHHHDVVKDIKDGDDLAIREAATQKTLKISHVHTKFERKTPVLSQAAAKQSTFQSRNNSMMKADDKIANKNVKHKPFARGTISRMSAGLERLRSAGESYVEKRKRELAAKKRRSSPATRIKRVTAYEQRKHMLEGDSENSSQEDISVTTDIETMSVERFKVRQDDRLNIVPKRMPPEGASGKPEDKNTSNEADSKQKSTYLGDGSIRKYNLKSNKSDWVASNITQHDTTRRIENITDEKEHGRFVEGLLHVYEGNPRGKTFYKLGGASHPQTIFASIQNKADTIQLPRNDEARSSDKSEKGKKSGIDYMYYQGEKHSQDGVTCTTTVSTATGSKSTTFPSTEVDSTTKSKDATKPDHLVDNTVPILPSRSADKTEKEIKLGKRVRYNNERKHSHDSFTTTVLTGSKSTIFTSTKVDYTNKSNDETKKYHLTENKTLPSRSEDQTEMGRKSGIEYNDERKHSQLGVTTTGRKSTIFPSTEVDNTNTSNDETKTDHLDDLPSSRGNLIEGHDETEQKNLCLNMADIEQCERICTFIKNKSDKILYVWPAYDTNKDKSLIFVCMATENVEIDVEYILYIRIVGHYSEEGKRVMQSRKNAKNRLSAAQSEKINNVIDHYANILMQKHRYISIITGSGVRSVGFATENEEIIPEACVVIYVLIKGKIPLNEKEIPKSLEGIPVDIREGDFQTCVLTPSDFHKNLRMGCQIMSSANQYGTLGGFVEHPEYGLCGITCAHVVMNEDDMHDVRGKDNVSCQIKVYQPDNNRLKNFVGQVRDVKYKTGGEGVPGIDLAVFQIANRPPEYGNFPGTSNSETDLVYESGKVGGEKQFNIYDQQVVKFGSKSGLTNGFVEFAGTGVRKIDYEREYIAKKNQRYTYTLFGQLEIRPSDSGRPFNEGGDSGGLVFKQDVTGNLICIGMVVGAYSNGNGIVTPISAIKRHLGVSEFKNFTSNKIDRLERGVQIMQKDMQSMKNDLQTMKKHMEDISSKLGVKKK